MAYIHVEASASGSNNGTDWTNAYTSLQTAINNASRGDTIYVATGDYRSEDDLDVQVATSGTTRITIKKASPTEHGSETGWNAAFGVGQAYTRSFEGNFNYLTIDGSYGGFNPDAATFVQAMQSFKQGYGFVIESYADTYPDTALLSDSDANGFIIDRCEVRSTHNNGEGDRLVTLGDRAFLAESTGITIRRCWFHQHLRTFISLFYTNGTTIEHCAFNDQIYGAVHSTLVVCFQVVDFTFRWNYVRNGPGEYAGGSGLIGTYLNGSIYPNELQTHAGDGMYCYGNIFWGGIQDSLLGGNLGCLGSNWYAFSPEVTRNVLFYNNTLVDCVQGSPGSAESLHIPQMWNNFVGGYAGPRTTIRTDLGCMSANNLLASVYGTGCIGVPSMYNQYSDVSTYVNYHQGGTVGDVTNSQTKDDLFVDSDGEDYRLIANTAAGVTLPSPYNVDMFGNEYGSNGQDWSRGAIQFDGSPPQFGGSRKLFLLGV